MTAPELRSAPPLSGLAATPTVAVVTAPDRQSILAEWNETATEYPRDNCIHELFEQQVERTPDAIAVAFNGQQLTYAQLNQRANQLAHFLRNQGVGPDVCVGLCAQRSLQMLLGVLGILKAGGAYVPIDPSYPPARAAYMLRDARVALVLTHGDVQAVLSEVEATRVQLEQVDPHLPTQNLANTASPRNAAYVLYTSGSTGRPKGVVMHHSALVNLIYWQMQTLPTKARTLQFTSIGFDVSFQEIFTTWCSGGALVVIQEEHRRNPAALLQILEQEGIERLFVPFAVLQHLARTRKEGAATPHALREVITAGEQLQVTPEIVRFFGGAHGPTLYNQYGPTEAHVVTAYPLGGLAEQWPALPPIGRPIANAYMRLLDRNLHPVAQGEPGELCIGGMCLSRGYLARPDLTAEKFIPDPLGTEPGARLYRTGDLAKYLPDGNIDFLGRIDAQVKIRGYRIELGEIESVLREHPGIQEAVVIAREDVPGDRRLVGYLVAPDEKAIVDLRASLRARLPEYMVPSAFVRLDALPLTTNGKVDRRALPAPGGERIAVATALVAPRTPTERWLVETWQSQIGIHPIGIQDNFFEVGGHSLMAVRIFDLIQKELGRSLSPATLFQAPTVETLAAILDQEDWKPDWKCLVAIRPNGTRPPFFFIHGARANVLFYQVLAKYLPTDIPLFAVQSLGLDGQTEPLKTVEEMAEFYLREIRSVQPEGPYYLGGMSFGGIVALEIAQRLYTQGQETRLVAMLNSECPGGSPYFPKRSGLFQHKIIPRVLRAETSFITLRQKGLAAFLRNKIRPKASHRTVVDDELSSKRISDQEIVERIFRLNQTAERKYRPHPYPGRITLLYTAERHPIQYPDTDTRLAWSDYAEGGLEVHLIPGDHVSMRKEPHVKVLTAKLSACLNQAMGSSLDNSPLNLSPKEKSDVANVA